jgi:hypothetical protein
MVRYAAAESGSELSCGNTAGTNSMSETVTADHPPVAKGAATVSASALALHLDCSRAYIGKLEAEGVIQRLFSLAREAAGAFVAPAFAVPSGGW